MTTEKTSDLRVIRLDPLDPPNVIKGESPTTPKVAETVVAGRQQLRDALAGKDRRLVVILGPCSIHEPKAAMEYAEKLVKLNAEVEDTLYLIIASTSKNRERRSAGRGSSTIRIWTAPPISTRAFAAREKYFSP
jgi:phospho-2-dehydro-3-deoxyheptonate aldolase